jgi:hypothetical protein
VLSSARVSPSFSVDVGVGNHDMCSVPALKTAGKKQRDEGTETTHAGSDDVGVEVAISTKALGSTIHRDVVRGPHIVTTTDTGCDENSTV